MISDDISINAVMWPIKETKMHKSKIFSSFFLAVLVLASIQMTDSVTAENQLPKLEGGNNAEQSAIDKAIAKAYPALVRIDVVVEEPSSGRMIKMRGAGSGAIISDDGYIITNHHVAGKTKRLICRLFDGEEVPATLIGTDKLADIAVIKLDLSARKNKQPLVVAAFGDSDKVKIGDTVFAMGCPSAVSQSVTKGIMSNIAMTMPDLFWPMTFNLDGENVGELVRWLAHDAVIYGGNSGGPLVNAEGEIIGINEIGLGSLGGAIPSNLAKSVADQLIKKGIVERSWIGLDCQPILKSMSIDKGILVAGVVKESPADKAGIKAGDIVTEYDGNPVKCLIPDDIPLFNKLVLSTPIGKSVAVKYLRDGKEESAKITTLARGRATEDDVELPSWGITARNFTMLSALEKKRKNTDGVIVRTLREGGPCKEAKPNLNNGDIITAVNGDKIKDLGDLTKFTEKITKDKTDPVPVMVSFERDTKEYITVVKVGKSPDIDKPGLTKKAWLPAATQVLTKDIAKALNLEGSKGVRVIKVYKGHSAEAAGMKAGDVLLKLDGEIIDASEVHQSDVLTAMIKEYKIGSDGVFDAVRDGKPVKLTVKFEESQKSNMELKSHKDDNFEITLRELSFDDKMEKELDENFQGLLFDRIESGSWVQLGHVMLGDLLISIDGKPTPDVDTAKKILAEAAEKKAKRIVFFVRRGVHTLFLEVEPVWQK